MVSPCFVEEGADPPDIGSFVKIDTHQYRADISWKLFYRIKLPYYQKRIRKKNTKKSSSQQYNSAVHRIKGLYQCIQHWTDHFLPLQGGIGPSSLVQLTDEELTSSFGAAGSYCSSSIRGGHTGRDAPRARVSRGHANHRAATGLLVTRRAVEVIRGQTGWRCCRGHQRSDGVKGL